MIVQLTDFVGLVLNSYQNQNLVFGSQRQDRIEIVVLFKILVRVQLQALVGA